MPMRPVDKRRCRCGLVVLLALLVPACASNTSTNRADARMDDVSDVRSSDTGMSVTGMYDTNGVGDAYVDIAGDDGPSVADRPEVAIDAPGMPCGIVGGRPCYPHTCCTDWCNACYCISWGPAGSMLSCTAALCTGEGPRTPTADGGRYQCDPTDYPPTETCAWHVCGRGYLHPIIDGRIVDSQCVPVVDCLPIACDPGQPAACPPPTACDPVSRTCLVPRE